MRGVNLGLLLLQGSHGTLMAFVLSPRLSMASGRQRRLSSSMWRGDRVGPVRTAERRRRPDGALLVNGHMFHAT